MGLIRFMLAIAVLNSHFPVSDIPLVGGHEAVLAFFVISGFYMALILDTSYATTKGFYLSRFLTLYPIYVFALIVSVAMLTSLDLHPMTTMSRVKDVLADPLGFVALAWTSVAIVGQELLFCLGIGPDTGLHILTGSRKAIWLHAPLIQAWSLSLEIMFYAMAPLLARLRTRHLLALTAASLCLKIAIVAGPLVDVVFFKRFFPAEFWLFGCGMLAYRLHTVLPKTPRLSDLLFFAALVATILVAGEAPEEASSFALPVAVIVALPLVFRCFRHYEFDRFVGKLSYPFYLLHFHVIAIFETYHDDPEGWQILAVTTVAALFTHSLFNTGLESLKSRLRARPTVGAAPAPAPVNP